MALNGIDTIIFVMLENRSFDQMLGYLSLDDTPGPLAVDGLRSDPAWQRAFANSAGGNSYPLKKLAAAQAIRQDPPHGHESIGRQIETPPAGPGADKMGGFVATYLDAHERVDDPGAVMGYYGSKDVPTYDFLARNFCVCDRWFTSLPLGTQANRLMAMAGQSKVLDNVIGLPNQQLVYDWLDARGIGWRAYISGGYAPFFIMMRRWALKIVGSLAIGNGPFRRFSAFRKEWQSTNNPRHQ